MKFSEEEIEALIRARQVLAKPNVSVAGGELAMSGYLAALHTIDYLLDKIKEERVNDGYNQSISDS